MLSGDEFYDDDTTSGPLYDGDPYAWLCDQCGAEPGEDCRPWCTSLLHAQDDAGTEYGILFRAPRCSEWLTAIVTSLSLRSWGHDRA